MAYNLQSLITILEQILDPQQKQWIIDDNKAQLQSLLEKSVSLQQIFEKTSLSNIECLESEIRDAAHKAEDMIESHMVDQILDHYKPQSLLQKMAYNFPPFISKTTLNPQAGDMIFTFTTPDLQQVMQELDSAMEQVAKLVEEKAMPRGSSSSGASFSQSKALVGLDGPLLQLKDRLFGMQSKLEMVPVVGMGGIGKTTLARKLYQDELIVSRFQYRAWTTVSQDYDIRAILVSLLRCVTGKEYNQDISDLKDELYRGLYGRRYFVVLDDIWSIKFWDEIRMYLPDNNNGSRIVITTRESEVAKHANSQSVQHQMQLLSVSASWDLLCQIVFGEEGCPDFLQGIGQNIARDCGGLPLAISVIGGLLSKVERSKDGWENVGKDVRAAIAKSDEQFSQILSLSYNHLSNHLKPCFLYMGAFPEDYEIRPSKLVHLWVAEGFVKSNGDRSLEEEAEDCLKALVERNLVMVKRYKRHNGKPKSYIIHDLLRDLCMRKAYEDKFMCVKNSPNVTLSICNILGKCLCMSEADEHSNSRRVSVHASCGMEDVYVSAKLISLSLARSFLSTKNRMILSSFFCALRLVRVLDVMDVWFPEFPAEILQLVNLRFLAVSCNSSIPREITRLWNLQTLIASISSGVVPFEIWEMSELRHLKLDQSMVFRYEDVKEIVCKKLQMISMVCLSSLVRIWRSFFEGIPNIKDLGIYYDCYGFRLSGIDLSYLHKLETLRCRAQDVGDSRGFWSTLKFPFALRKLTLHSIAIFPRVSTLLCSLPNLEVLKIERCAFKSEDEEFEASDQAWEAAEDEDEEWEVAEGDEFRSLQFLGLVDLKLKCWRADETNFPRLRRLRLSYCRKLEEIPSGIGEISTLQLIELQYCSDSVVASAKQIQEEQQSDYGNYDLKFIYEL